MHELSLCEAIAGMVRKHADGQRVTQVNVRIGYMRQVVPDALQFSWELITDVTDLRGCSLVIDHVPAVVSCRSCLANTTLDLPILACSHCGGFDVELISGDEFFVESMDVAEVNT